MANDHIKSEISAYLTGELPPSKNREIEAHVAGCEACRQAMSKARAKQARHKRQALKDAVPNPIPNLLVKRLDRQAGYNPEPGRQLQIRIGFLLAVAFGAVAVYSGWIPVHSWKIFTPHLRPTPELKIPEPDVSTLPPSASTETVVAALPPPLPAAPPPAEAEAEAPKVWVGSDSRIKEFRTIVIKGRNAWSNLWDDMGQPGSAPRVNFRENLVVGILGGERGGASARVFLGSAQENPDEIVISYKITGTDVSSSTVTDVSHPYSLQTIPRTTKEIRFAPES